MSIMRLNGNKAGKLDGEYRSCFVLGDEKAVRLVAERVTDKIQVELVFSPDEFELPAQFDVKGEVVNF